MMGVEPAGQRAERRHDELGRRDRRSSAAKRCRPLQVSRSLGWIMARHFGPRVVARRLRGEGRSRRSRPHPRCRPPQWSAKPGSWLPTIHVQSRRAVSVGQQRAGARPAAGRSRSGRGSCRRGNRGALRRSARPRRRARSASRANHKAAGTGRAARTSSLFRGAGRRPAAPAGRGQNSAPSARREECFACERKGNHGPAVTPARRSI